MERESAFAATISVQSAVRSRVAVQTWNWGWLPLLSLISALGLLMLALAYNGARVGAVWAPVLFWASVLMLVAPTAARLFSQRASRHERIGLVVILGLALYLVKFLHSPVTFTFSDEHYHWRNVLSTLASSHLFQENSLLPITTLYPGLQIVTSATTILSDLPIFGVASAVIIAARLMLLLALYHLYEQISRSPRVAGIGVLLYVTNPNFVFFGAQFAYESLALPMLALVLFLEARRLHTRDGGYFAVALAVGALVAIHHMSSYVLVAFLALWTATSFIWSRLGRHQPAPIVTTILALAASIAWLIFVAQPTLNYLLPSLTGGINELIQMINGEATGRELFRSHSGELAPLWERLVGFGAVALIVLGLPFGLRQIWKWYRANALALAMAMVALMYPITLVLRLTKFGWELSSRTSEFVFIAVAIVLALGLAKLRLPKVPFWAQRAILVTYVVVIFLGGVIAGWAQWARMPGPYLVSADTRSIEQQGIAAAEWMLDALGPNNRVFADRINRLLMGTYGLQRLVTNIADRLNGAWVVLATDIGEDERDLIRRARIEYIVIDRRLTTGLPVVGVYFERGEPFTYERRTPVDPKVFAKFDDLDHVSRLYDSGDIIIYDMRTFLDE